MSRKQEQARAAASAYEIHVKTAGESKAVVKAADRAAAGSAGKMRGPISLVEEEHFENGEFAARYVMKGPGGLMNVMDFVLVGVPDGGGGLVVQLGIRDFLYQKSTFTKPTINGSRVLESFIDIFKAELAAL